MPEVSSERRTYIPIGFLKPEVMASNKLRIFEHANFYHFGILSSMMHMAWTRAVCGRLESRYQYSVHIVYNNFPGRKIRQINKNRPLKPPRRVCWMPARNFPNQHWPTLRSADHAAGSAQGASATGQGSGCRLRQNQFCNRSPARRILI